MRHIVVIGCGFAGYHAARRLEEGLAGRRRVQLTVVTRRAHFVFSPLLSSVASAELEPEDVTISVDNAFRPRTRVVIDHVDRIDFEDRKLYCEHQTIAFDYLLIATGGVRDNTTMEGAGGLLGPDTLTDAVTIRDRIEKIVAAEEYPIRFAIIGASTTGVEWAAELATSLALDKGLSCHQEKLEIDLYEAGPRLLPDHSAALSDLATRALDEQGIGLHTGHKVLSAEPTGLILEDTSRVDASLVFHCGGRVGIPLWEGEQLTLDDRNRIVVDQKLRAQGVTGVFVAGDAASRRDDLPKSSNPQIARQQGEQAARNLLADMTGRSKRNFQFEDRGDFVTLGRNNAILEVRGLILEGKAAWLAYRLFYTALMPRPFQKTRMLMDWVGQRMGLPTDEINENGDEEDSSSP